MVESNLIFIVNLVFCVAVFYGNNRLFKKHEKADSENRIGASNLYRVLSSLTGTVGVNWLFVTFLLRFTDSKFSMCLFVVTVIFDFLVILGFLSFVFSKCHSCGRRPSNYIEHSNETLSTRTISRVVTEKKDVKDKTEKVIGYVELEKVISGTVTEGVKYYKCKHCGAFKKEPWSKEEIEAA